MPRWLLLSLALAAIVLILAACRKRESVEPLPPITYVASEGDAIRAVILAGYVPQPMRGWSMHPWIPGGDGTTGYVGTERVPFDRLLPGHVVVYQIGQQPTMHRLGQRDSAGNFVAYGIGNPVKDPIKVTPLNYIARVDYVAAIKR